MAFMASFLLFRMACADGVGQLVRNNGQSVYGFVRRRVCAVNELGSTGRSVLAEALKTNCGLKHVYAAGETSFLHFPSWCGCAHAHVECGGELCI
eukprot:2922846-Pleurochrysis_carterae.AAC.1